ncbi:glycosyl transferase family 2 [Pelobium manganitolerans]|uniref:Glycosyl transferase family 2 n=1 Tax=Pelobium manganitolerans TaxID=1842495 RepID=A0A419S3V5_9SPHI|nr:glycosyltransferase family A protein [Pelobium manganitolerans]RKD14329.1 glycosyl transferase family 2 [Pelobium manganitolerans]
MAVALFKLPKWVKRNLYKGKSFSDLTDKELADIHRKLQRFKSPDPEVSVMIPAWNEENNIFRTLSSLANSRTKRKVELVVINNNSTDLTQKVLDKLGVISYFEPKQGITFARQLGLERAKGKYHLCADSDTFYPPGWIDAMVAPLEKDDDVVGVYGRYAFIPENDYDRAFFWVYERLASVIIRLRRLRREHINFLGFNMGFITQVGLANGGFKVKNVRKFDNAIGSDYYVDESEDGRMAVNLMKTGRLKLVTDNKAVVFTSSRRLIAEGGILEAFKSRFKLHTNRLSEYLKGKKI